jgi:triosephosphate isomerase (TIM)
MDINSRSLIVANWKMNKTINQARDFIDKWHEITKDSYNDVVICPAFTLMHVLKQSFTIGAQDCCATSGDFGAFTGDVSALMLKDAGCEYVIIGHSERRIFYKESSQLIKQKISRAHEKGLNVILCVGENDSQRESGIYKDILLEQFDEAMCDVNIENHNKIIIAYEPIWAIGTGKVATIDQIIEIHQYLSDQSLSRFAERVKIIYGGSVNINNASAILAADMVSGLLIGGASLDAQAFHEIINMRK